MALYSVMMAGPEWVTCRPQAVTRDDRSLQNFPSKPNFSRFRFAVALIRNNAASLKSGDLRA